MIWLLGYLIGAAITSTIVFPMVIRMLHRKVVHDETCPNCHNHEDARIARGTLESVMAWDIATYVLVGILWGPLGAYYLLSLLGTLLAGLRKTPKSK